MIDFKNKKFRERKQQSFDKEKIFVEKCGKKINVYDMIQENREDTEIYPTLEKYGCIDKLMLNREELYEDFTEIQKMQDLRGVNDYKIAAENAFYKLPIEIRKEFDNNINKFTSKGAEYINKLKAEDLEKAAAKDIKITTIEENIETKGADNVA
ncbi:minor capsid protein [Capybara microvirus Cap1_SP_124]|nr:minor capsid protein [Capybara microvirus Cap1_SP_124]